MDFISGDSLGSGEVRRRSGSVASPRIPPKWGRLPSDGAVSRRQRRAREVRAAAKSLIFRTSRSVSGNAPEALVLVENAAVVPWRASTTHEARGDQGGRSHDSRQCVREQGAPEALALQLPIERQPSKEHGGNLARAAASDGARQVVAKQPVAGEREVRERLSRRRGARQTCGRPGWPRHPRHDHAGTCRDSARPSRSMDVWCCGSRGSERHAFVRRELLHGRKRSAPRASAAGGSAGASRAASRWSKNSAGTRVCDSCSRHDLLGRIGGRADELADRAFARAPPHVRCGPCCQVQPESPVVRSMP